ncbi:MAG: type IV pilus secretin PilQ [Thermodesulfobacteriota bacterium]
MKYPGNIVCNNPNIQRKKRVRGLMFFSMVISTFLIFACSPKSLQIKSETIKSEESLASKIQRLEISQEADRTKLTIQGLGAMSYTVFKLADPPKIVVDIPNADLGKLTGTIEAGNGIIDNINITKFDNKTGTVGRIEIALNKMADYEVAKDANRLVLYIKKPTDPELTSVDKTKAKEGGTVEGIDFRQITGKSQIIISTSSKARYNLSRVAKDTLVLELVEMDIPKKLREVMEIKEINSAVRLIKPNQTISSGKNTAKIDITLRTMVPYHIIQEENRIYLEFNQPQKALHKETASAPPVSAVPRTEVEAAMRAGETRNSEEGFQTEKAEKMTPAVELTPVEGGVKGKYTGKRVSMDFKDADIRNLFRLIAEVSNLNIVFGDEVKGKVTIRMVDVPWDQALDVILDTNNLGMIRAGNIIRIAPYEKIAKEEHSLIEKKKGTQEVEELVTETIRINYAVAKDILPHIQNKLSKRGKASADERTNSILITDIKGIVSEAKKIIRELDTPTPQVLIEARIVQSNPTFTRELGVQWGGTYSRGVSSGTYTVSGTAGSNYAINLPSSLTHGGLGFGLVNSSATLDLKLTAMEKDEKVKIISRPKIITMDNKKAKIEQGVALPYPKMSSEGTVSTEFKMATLLLEVTPHITPDGSIIMKVLAKKDQKSSQTGYGGEPGIDTRSAETEVIVKDGDTTVIGGIYESTQTDAISGVPFLSNIPILGWLFKSKYKKDEVTELLIFLTPTIVKQKPVN